MKEKNLRPFNDFKEYQTEHPLAHQLPYWEFLNDLVVLADASLVLGFELRGIAIETFDTESINKLTLNLRALLNSLPDGCEISILSEIDSQYESILQAHSAVKGTNPLVGWLTDSRISMLENEIKLKNVLKSHLYLFIYQRFERENKAGFNFFTPPSKFVEVKKINHERLERELRQKANGLMQALENIGVQCQKLGEECSRKMIYRFLNPKRCESSQAPKPEYSHKDQEFTPSELSKIPSLSLPSPREQLIFSDVIQGYDTLYYDGFYHRTITLKTLPEFTHSALISRLALPFPNALHIHIKVPEQSKELSSLQAKRRMAHSMSVSTGGRASDLESQAKLNSTEELLEELINTGQKIFYFQMVVLLKAETRDELDTQTRSTLSKLREMNGAEGMAETVANFKVWKTLLPFGNTAMVRSKRIKTDNLADFLPLYQAYDGGA